VRSEEIYQIHNALDNKLPSMNYQSPDFDIDLLQCTQTNISIHNLHTWELSGWYKVNSYDLVNAVVCDKMTCTTKFSSSCNLLQY